MWLMLYAGYMVFTMVNQAYYSGTYIVHMIMVGDKDDNTSWCVFVRVMVGVGRKSALAKGMGMSE